jgi:hypothetical protein
LFLECVGKVELPRCIGAVVAASLIRYQLASGAAKRLLNLTHRGEAEIMDDLRRPQLGASGGRGLPLYPAFDNE